MKAKLDSLHQKPYCRDPKNEYVTIMYEPVFDCLLGKIREIQVFWG